MAKQVDGVILCAPFSSDAQLARLAQATALVLVNRRLPDMPAVLMDAAHGMRQVVEHLVGLGHRRLAYLGGPRKAWSNHERRRGLRAAARLHAVELLEYGPLEPKFAGGILGTDLALSSGASAIVAFNDLMALGVLSRLAAFGIRVPDDLAVVGCDDILYAAMCAPPLTTVAMPMELAGRMAVDLLLARHAKAAKGTGDTHARVQTQLILRATTTAAPKSPRRRKSGEHASEAAAAALEHSRPTGS